MALIVSWAVLVAAGLGIYFFYEQALTSSLEYLFSTSAVIGGGLYLFFSCVRGFTLIPVTILIVAGIPFIPPTPLLLMTLAGVAASSATIYYFSEILGMDELLKRRYGPEVEKVRRVLVRNEFSIITGWSMLPFVPTDVICYVSGTLRLNFPRFISAILIGEAITCALYIYGGAYLLEWLEF